MVRVGVGVRFMVGGQGQYVPPQSSWVRVKVRVSLPHSPPATGSTYCLSNMCQGQGKKFGKCQVGVKGQGLEVGLACHWFHILSGER